MVTSSGLVKVLDFRIGETDGSLRAHTIGLRRERLAKLPGFTQVADEREWDRRVRGLAPPISPRAGGAYFASDRAAASAVS
jgi:hypothetical protein